MKKWPVGLMLIIVVISANYIVSIQTNRKQFRYADSKQVLKHTNSKMLEWHSTASCHKLAWK